MAVANPKVDYAKQIKETRKCIREKFKKTHEALVVRENILLSRVDEIEREYDQKMKLKNEIVESIKVTKSSTSENLKANVLTETRDQIVTLLDSRLRELTADIVVIGQHCNMFSIKLMVCSRHMQTGSFLNNK